MTKTGFVPGSDLLIKINQLAVGHCTTHSLNWAAETQSRTYKPGFSDTTYDGKWDDKSIKKLSASIDSDGLRFYNEAEGGYQKLLALYAKAEPVAVECYERGSADPYAYGNFVITSLKENAPAGDDATYSISLESAGKVVINSGKLTGAPLELPNFPPAWEDMQAQPGQLTGTVTSGGH